MLDSSSKSFLFSTLEIKMSVIPVSSLNNRSEISPSSAGSPEGSLRGEEQEAKTNYDNKLHRARSFYDRLIEFIECIENSDAERGTIHAELVKICGEIFFKIANAMPKNDEEFAKKVDLDVEGLWALVVAAQEALDKMKKEK